ncbi:MAG: oxidoreductase [Minisyncoccia bacterium]
MYKLVLYGLMILAGISVIFGFLGILSYSGLSLIYSLLILTTICYATNFLFAKIFKVQTNSESYLISALILFFIAFPAKTLADFEMLVLVGIVAMASKYILAIKKKHVFNPVAVSVFILGIFGSGVGAWWIGSSVMLIPTILLGFLILRKVKRFSLFFSFFLTATVSILVVGIYHSMNIGEILSQMFASWPIIFFGTIMLTEPLTTPPTRALQVAYGALVGLLFGVQFQIGPLYSTPEFALIVGNLFSYIVSPRLRLVLTLSEKKMLPGNVYEFIWKLDKKTKFKAGQYLEWTLGHKHPDIRGNRRFFTIASSPTENDLRLGVKFYDSPSSFKKKLSSLNPGDTIIASQLAGDFTLPDDPKKKLVFIAGGIGVTPFRSMIKNLSDNNDKRNVTLFFSNRTPKDIVYKDVFDSALQKVGLRTIYAVNDLAGDIQTPNMRVGFIDADMIKKEVPDYRERIFYISGPHGMITAFEDTLQKLGVSSSNIKTDFFPGFV